MMRTFSTGLVADNSKKTKLKLRMVALASVSGVVAIGAKAALISAPYTRVDGVQGSLGVLGPTRMHYERAINAVAYVAKIFSESLSKIS